MMRARIVGVYAALPAEPVGRQSLTSAVLDLPGCDGLEIPFGSLGYEQDRQWLWDRMPPSRTHVFTLVAATMEALGQDEAWGPASSSQAGRAAFLGLLSEARDEVARVTAAGHRVLAVEIQSAPRGTAQPAPNSAALRETLAVAAAWNWCGASLTIEHCDAFRSGQPHAKGFLNLEEEIAAVQAIAGNSGTDFGITINWGRSAIDCHKASSVDAQITQARRAGVLRGLMISGTTGSAGAFGPAWSDSHAPLYDADPLAGEPTSVLTEELVGRAIRAAGDDLQYDGVKVGVRPRDATHEHRLAVISRVMRAMG